MNWKKKGLIYAPERKVDRIKHSALQPTPYVPKNSRLRIYAGFGIRAVGAE
jgi:hypothetical protein